MWWRELVLFLIWYLIDDADLEGARAELATMTFDIRFGCYALEKPDWS